MFTQVVLTYKYLSVSVLIHLNSEGKLRDEFYLTASVTDS